jgi:hypothetical protein
LRKLLPDGKLHRGHPVGACVETASYRFSPRPAEPPLVELRGEIARVFAFLTRKREAPLKLQYSTPVEMILTGVSSRTSVRPR